MKKVLIIGALLIVVIGSIFYIGINSKLKDFSKEVAQIEVSNIDMDRIDDGIYTGEFYMSDFVGAKVKVTVDNNEITKIEFLDHKYGKGRKAEVITEDVIEKQSLEVDAISGATGSSRVILKAIEDALVKN